MLREDPTLFERVAAQEDVNHGLIYEEVDQAKANAVDLNSVAYMEAPVPEIKNASTWAVLQSPTLRCHMLWRPNRWRTGPCTKARLLDPNGMLFFSFKTLSIKSHE